ncbi:FG-GAP-like repeat-containing protein [Rubrivirga marina]|uniref:ASPIC/UnbV domain-containing protein n=1 Tax=Rubrivirga marina TaxID=1196024 RepID=A0A271J3C1_9BACT|nr:FG-GAP-like repeat-containing protein [Rubrivirga marina]PAP78021.1 hypothetical protein BSZ37_17025 [Rubrivirga marina]
MRFLLAGLSLVLAAPAAAQGFVERTFDAGLGALSNTNGVAIADYDRDGDLDLYLVARRAYDPANVLTWSRLYENDGTGTFEDVTLSAGIDVELGATPGADTRNFGYQYVAAWGDYDNDGWPDLFLGHLGPDQLFHNNGDGTFSDVTAEAGVSGAEAGGGYVSASGLWFDYDQDGDLDLYVGSWWDYGPDRDLSNRLYSNDGDGTFTDVSEASGLADPDATWMALPFDANADGLTDLYLSTDIDTTTGVGINRLYVNEGDRTFREATAEFGLEDENYGMGLALADPDRNGLLDLYLTNVATPTREQRNPLWLQTAPGQFEDVAEAVGVDIADWGWGTEFFDMENDGDEDLLVVTGLFDPDYTNHMFRNDLESGSFSFTRVSAAVGLDADQAARGVAVFDADGDGDQDVVVSNVFRAPYLYENTLPQGEWLDVELEGTASNGDGLGATVTAWVDGVPHTRLHHGAQYLAQNLTPVHLGLGTAATVDSLVVAWPSGQTDRLLGLATGQRIRVKEGEGRIGATAADGGPTVPTFRVAAGPNPAGDRVRIRVSSDALGPVQLEVFDVLGRRVHVAEADGVGARAFAWTPRAAGAYVYRVTCGAETMTGRLTVVGR